MSESDDQQRRRTARRCISCGVNISGTTAAAFPCPSCGHRIYRCATCRKQSNLYECPECDFRGP